MKEQKTKPSVIEAVNVTRCPPGWAKLLESTPWKVLRPGWRVRAVDVGDHITVQQKQTFCMDCLGSEPEPYMVHNDIWKEAVPDRKGILCIRCLEDRLGRKVVVGDLTPARINGIAKHVSGQEAVVTGPRRKDVRSDYDPKKDKTGLLRYALRRPDDYFSLDGRSQWAIDARLGILDWSPDKDEADEYNRVMALRKGS